MLVCGIAAGIAVAMVLWPAREGIGSWFVESRQKPTIVFVGDMMFDRSIRTAVAARGARELFSCLDDLLRADLVVGNLEGPITTLPSVSVGSKIASPENYIFTFPTSTIDVLRELHVGLVNIGNNHILNFGYEGLAETTRWLDRASIAHMGDPSASEENRVYRVELRGVPFSFVNWNDWTSGDVESVSRQIRSESNQGRIVVVYAHWGEEYMAEARGRTVETAHRLVDAGARLVVGSHPHVVQQHEDYLGVPIYYSLGNFIFDQYWEVSVRTGLLLRVVFDEDGTARVSDTYVSLSRDGSTCPVIPGVQ